MLYLQTKDGGILVEGEKISRILVNGEQPPAQAKKIDLRDLTVTPGLIDIHVHGGNNHDVMDGTYEAINAISLHKLKEGVTSFCPTTLTAPEEQTLQAIANIRQAKEKGVDGARIIGGFLEGPFLNPQYKGAHPESDLLPPKRIHIEKMLEAGQGAISSIAIAPELPGALEIIEWLTSIGIQTRIGHSAATLAETDNAVKKGANTAIHFYNAMSPLHHREPGMTGAVLTNPHIYAELICDFVHAHKRAVEVLVRSKQEIILVSDCIRAGGLPDGNYTLGNESVTVQNGIARNQNGALAGSTICLIEAIKNMHHIMGVPLTQTIAMATSAPAKALGIYDKVGSIEPGKFADIIGLDNNLEVHFTMIGGRINQA